MAGLRLRFSLRRAEITRSFGVAKVGPLGQYQMAGRDVMIIGVNLSHWNKCMYECHFN